MEFENQIDNLEEKKKRPVFLTVLCILTFIATGYGFLTGVLIGFGGKPSTEFIQEQQVKTAVMADEFRTTDFMYFAEVMDKLGRMQTEVFQNYSIHSLITVLTSIIGFFGAWLMFKGRKMGFHAYIIYSIASVASIYLVASPMNISSFYIVVNLSVAAIFVLMYSRNLKWLK
jgi:hypothetical protein